MSCVIQQVMKKQPNRYGEPLEIITYQNQWRPEESKPLPWGWKFSEGRFERSHLEAYKITLHQSCREGETAILKKFCQKLSKIYHPDLNPGEGTAEAMKLLNRLKEQWGV